MTADRKPTVVIIGAGFGGLVAAQGLRDVAVDVIVIDRANHHTFQPLLYQVATAGLSAPQIASPIRHILRSQRNVRVLLGDAVAIDADRKRVLLTDGEVGFDYLIVATGVTHSYFGNDSWARYAPGLKTLDDALEIRRRILIAFERAEREPDAAERAAWLAFVIIGGGPTGVELAGTLAEIARHTLTDEFRAIDPAQARVLLLEGGARILNTYPETLSAKAARQLERLGVEVRVDAQVIGVDDAGVSVKSSGLQNERIAARTILWAAGVQATRVGAQPSRSARQGRPRTRHADTASARSRFDICGWGFGIGDARGRAGAGRCVCRQTDGRVRRACNCVARARRADISACAVSLPRPWIARDYRSQVGGGTLSRRNSTVRPAGVVDVALGAHFFPDRFSQSHHHDGGLDVGVSDVSATRAADTGRYDRANTGRATPRETPLAERRLSLSFRRQFLLQARVQEEALSPCEH